MNLEVEKKNNGNGYKPTNCELACFLCNNDKSSVIGSDDYLAFMAEGRKNYIQHLLNKTILPK